MFVRNRQRAVLVTVLLAACGDDPVTSVTDTATGEPDTTTSFDSFVPFDTGGTTDSGVTDTSTTATGTTATDTSSDSDTSTNECEADPKPFFCPCENNVQCESGYCITVDEETVARRCSRTCIDSCPDGWECRSATSGGDPVFICQPPIDTLCQTCTKDADCESIAAMCITFEDGKFCGRDCQSDPASCPDDYTCQNIDNELGQTLGYQCVPTSGSCQCPDGTDYANDPDNCGFCKNVCTYDGGVAGCENEACYLAGCQTGFVDLNDEDPDGCEYACTKTSDDDWPDATCTGSSCDQDCDGIDGEWARAIFVQAGPTNGSGAPYDPMNSIQAGIDAAASSGGTKDHVYVAAGNYNEQIALTTGVSVFGGYSNDGRWVRKLSQYTSTITNSSGTNSVRVVVADGIDGQRTVFDGFTVVAGTNANPGGSSYAIWVRSSSESLEIANVTAVGGNGGTGQNGSPGTKGNDGDQGKDGTGGREDGNCTSGWAGVCDDLGDGVIGAPGGNPGANMCPNGANAAGGKGGQAGCGPHDDAADKPAGGSPSPGGAPGGPAVSGEEATGNGGTGGSTPSRAAHGSAGLAAGQVDGSGFWRGFDGSTGTQGANGVGGGGGGGGGGGSAGCDDWGGGGGGGGSGGCGGTPGTGGKAGGGSFGLFLHNASPKLTASQFGHKSGGAGGVGGLGGGGGAGRLGGNPGGGNDGSGQGGAGGKGGDGAPGSHGGGGAGGVAYGMYLSGASDPACTSLGFNPPGSGGTGGLGGNGGDASGNKGADGTFGEKNKSSASCP